MATPFKDILDQVIDYSVREPPSKDYLEHLETYLSHQEDKLHAINRGLIPSLFKHYATLRQNSERQDSRLVIVRILESLMMLKVGRDILFSKIGTAKALAFLTDEALAVRVMGSKLLGKLAYFPDAQDEILQDRVIIDALIEVFLNDEIEVGLATVPALASLCEFEPKIDQKTIQRLLEILRHHSELIHKGNSLDLCRDILQCIWNVSCDTSVKEIAIDCKVVDAVSPLLRSRNQEIRRLSSGILNAISVAARGKRDIISHDYAVSNLCSVALNIKAPTEMRQNAILAIRNVADESTGLHACGKHLITECDILDEILTHEQTAKIIASLITDQKYETNSLQALNILVKDTAGRKAAFNIFGIVPRLYALEHSGNNQRTKGLARRALEALCADNPLAQAEVDKLAVMAELQDTDETAGSGLLAAGQTAILLIQFQNDFTMKAGVLHSLVHESMEESQMLWNTVDLVEKARRKGVLVMHLPLIYEVNGSSGSEAYGHFQKIVEGNAFAKGSWGSQVLPQIHFLTLLISENLHNNLYLVGNARESKHIADQLTTSTFAVF